jgi:hypothetical protein
MKIMKINAGASVKAAYGGYMSSKGNTPMAKKKEEDKVMKAGHGGMAHKKKAKKPYR